MKQPTHPLLQALEDIRIRAREGDPRSDWRDIVASIAERAIHEHGDMQSVLQPWVMRLPLREQGTLLTAVRGCDLTPKFPLDAIERRLVACIRRAFMNPANPSEVDYEPGSFMSLKIPLVSEFKPSVLGHYPLHWVMHVMHAMEVIAYRHPDSTVAGQFFGLYMKLCHSLHLPIESRDDMFKRLSEDRIITGTVVS